MADQVVRFLDKIAQLESSGGANIDHSAATKGGPNKGQTAIGRYGLMPNTIAEVASRTSMPEAELNVEELAKKVQTDPQFEEKIARNLASMVLTRSGGDEEKAAYSWLMGHNIDPSQITDEQLQNSGYVQKYKELKVPQDVEYKDNPQVNPPPREKGFLERIKDSVSSVTPDLDDMRVKHNAMIAAVLSKADPNLTREQALEQARRMTDLSEQAGAMSGGIADVGREAARKAVGALRASRGKAGFGLPAAADETARTMEEFAARDKGGLGRQIFEDVISPMDETRLSKLKDAAPVAVREVEVAVAPPKADRLKRMMDRTSQEPGMYESGPAAADVEAQLAALKRIREGR